MLWMSVPIGAPLDSCVTSLACTWPLIIDEVMRCDVKPQHGFNVCTTQISDAMDI